MGGAIAPTGWVLPTNHSGVACIEPGRSWPSSLVRARLTRETNQSSGHSVWVTSFNSLNRHHTIQRSIRSFRQPSCRSMRIGKPKSSTRPAECFALQCSAHVAMIATWPCSKSQLRFFPPLVLYPAIVQSPPIP